jgi:hypothetical protein
MDTSRILGLSKEKMILEIITGKNLENSTLIMYRGYTTLGMVQRLCQLRFWSSILLLLPDAPQNTPSISVEDSILFCKFKYGDAGAVLKDHRGQTVSIECSGKWKTMGNLGRYAAAISATHCNRGQGRGYVEKCSVCFQKFQSWGYYSTGLCSSLSCSKIFHKWI